MAQSNAIWFIIMTEYLFQIQSNPKNPYEEINIQLYKARYCKEIWAVNCLFPTESCKKALIKINHFIVPVHSIVQLSLSFLLYSQKVPGHD